MVIVRSEELEQSGQGHTLHILWDEPNWTLELELWGLFESQPEGWAMSQSGFGLDHHIKVLPIQSA